jgi:hypothetical protein
VSIVAKLAGVIVGITDLRWRRRRLARALRVGVSVFAFIHVETPRASMTTTARRPDRLIDSTTSRRGSASLDRGGLNPRIAETVGATDLMSFPRDIDFIPNGRSIG